MAWRGQNDGGGAAAILVGAVQAVCTVTIPAGAQTLWAEVAITSDSESANLDAFEVQYRPHASGGFHTVADAAADFQTAFPWPVLWASDDLTTASDGSDYAIALNVRAVDAVRFNAAMSGATSSDVEILISWQIR